LSESGFAGFKDFQDGSINLPQYQLPTQFATTKILLIS